jgi:CheY-like chemotaxis protein
MPEDAERCLDAGMNGHLAKPITHTTLYAAIDRVLGETDVTPTAEAA